jgi:hypothetical protein
MKIIPIAAVLALALCGAAQAQDSAASAAQRDANQQRRIAEGLKSGQISVREAGRLEREQQRLEEMQARALSNGGGLDPREQDRLEAELNGMNREIRSYKNDGKNANPDEISARRLAELVQRSANQQQRIARGLTAGELSADEAARVERGQARVSGMLADATGDGYVGGAEQSAIANLQSRQDQRIYARNHDNRDRGARDRY